MTRKQQNGNKYIPIDNCFKCKWTKFSNQKAYSGWMLKKKKRKRKAALYAVYKTLISD